ncbi:MAG: FtsX-like permease family protein [Halanaerobiales bacterium]|nr:FtsX-like permease family protein [Halanaerobiales bacterium]
MLLKMLTKDFVKKKIITISLVIFIVLATLLVASGSNMIVELFNSLNDLFAKSEAPHFVQMHVGEINRADIDNWASNNSLVKDKQIAEMINIDGSNVYLGNSHTTQKNSVMDMYFLKQNKSFDYLLDTESQVIQVSKGEIAVPIYFMQSENMKIGDKVKISNQVLDMELTVVAFVRDPQMNASIVHSKRFVVNKVDFDRLKNNIGEVEYLIEFLLTDLSKISEFTNAYALSNLPQKGPTIDYNLFKTLNALSDGIIVVVIILVSILLNIIALLCIRFTIITTIEEDYREIGVMKAIGIKKGDIKKIYLVKYTVMAALASLIGYLVSLSLNHLFTANIMLYIGNASKSILQSIIPLMAVGLVFLIVVFFCILILRRFNKISAVEALRAGNMGERQKIKNHLSLNKSKFFNVNIFLGLKDVFQRSKMFSIIFFVFFICSFIIISPVNFLNTMQSPDFINYMGIGRSDIRIDLRQSEDISERYNDMITYIKKDKDVEEFSPTVTCEYNIINNDGVQENIKVETGDFTIFPLEYLNGDAPIHNNEIALSYLNANEMNKSVGDTLRLVINEQEKDMLVSGIYQDVTNGGRTAKALLPFNPETVLWYVVSLDVKSDISIGEKIDEYEKAFYPAKVTHLEDYLNQTLGNTIEQLKLIVILTIVISIFILILITALFIKMLIAKDNYQIAVMKSMGFSLKNIRVQYVMKSLLVLNIAIILGTIFSNTIGQKLVSFLWSFMGASQIEFVINHVQAYILIPLALIIVVTITTLISIVSIKKSSITDMIVE